MDLRQLAVVVAVAEEGGFTAAAHRLDTVQSTVSTVVRALERDLGTPLFHRTTHRVALTPAGEAFVPAARAALEAVERARAAISPMHGRVRLGLAPGLLVDLHRVLAALRHGHPALEVEVRQLGPGGVVPGESTVDVVLAVAPGCAGSIGGQVPVLGCTRSASASRASERPTVRCTGSACASRADEQPALHRARPVTTPLGGEDLASGGACTPLGDGEPVPGSARPVTTPLSGEGPAPGGAGPASTPHAGEQSALHCAEPVTTPLPGEDLAPGGARPATAPLTGEQPALHCAEPVTTPLPSEELVLATPSGGSRLAPADLSGLSLVDFPPGWAIRDAVDRAFAGHRVTLEVDDLAAAVDLVRAGLAACVLPASAAARFPDLTVRRFDRPPPWQLVATHHAEPSPAVAAVLAHLGVVSVKPG